MNRISTCLWFDHRATEAVQFYSEVFDDVKINVTSHYSAAGAAMSGQKEGSVMLVEFALAGRSLMALNGGPIFKFSPALSFTVSCKDEADIQKKWRKLSEGGQIRMALDKYPWSEKYGWTADRYGVDWQLTLMPANEKLINSFLFVDSLFGKGEEALHFYTSIFPNSKVDLLVPNEKTKTVMYSAFTLDGQSFSLMEGEGKHGHTFTHATSLVVNCTTQAEIDHYWDKLSAGGSTEACGWLKDKFGVSWQIVPENFRSIMGDPSKNERVMKAMGSMKKLDLAVLMAAAK